MDKDKEKAGDAAAREIARMLEEEDRHVLLAIGSTGKKGKTSIDNVLGVKSEMPTGPLGQAAGDKHGAGPGGVADLNLGGSGGVVRPGERTGCTFCGPDVGRRDPATDDVGRQAEVKKPVPSTTVSRPDVAVGNLPDAGKVVASLRPMLRACYKHELDFDPNAKGSVRVTATIGPNGDVSSVQTAVSGLSSGMNACVSRVVRGAPFGAPVGGGSAQVAIPMSFYPQ
jgi:TonB family protein